MCSGKSELRKCGEAALGDQAGNLGLVRPHQDPRQRRASFAELILSAAEEPALNEVKGLRVTENRSFSHTLLEATGEDREQVAISLHIRRLAW